MPRTPSIGIDQDINSRYMDKYWGRCPQFLHKIPEAYIYICNPDYLWLLQSRVNDTLVIENISVELLRELDEVLALMCFVDSYDLYIDFVKEKKSKFNVTFPAQCDNKVSCSREFDVSCRMVPAKLPFVKFKICVPAKVSCAADLCLTPLLGCFEPVKVSCKMKTNCRPTLIVSSKDMMYCGDITSPTEINCDAVMPCKLDITIMALAQCINRSYNIRPEYKNNISSMIQYV